MGLYQLLRTDMQHYQNGGGWYRSTGFWIGATHRLGAWAHQIESTPLRLGVLAVYKGAAAPWQFFKNVSIPSRAQIGAGLCLHHPQNIIIPPTASIGKDCTLYQEVTLGRGPIPGTPQLGDHVTVFAGAKILGGVRIGDNVEIGANAVVTKDVPSGSIVSAAPARVIPRETAEMMRHRKPASEGG